MRDWLPVALLAGVGAFTAAAWALGRRAREKKYVALEQLGAALSLEPLGPRSFAPTVAGTRDGLGVLVQRVERRDLFLPARVDVLLQSRLTLVPAGGVLVRPGAPPHLEGTAEQRAALEAVLTPAVQEAAASLGGRFGFRSMDGLLSGSPFDVLVRLRWPEGWRNMLLRTWLPLDAGADDVRQAIAGLLAVRAALASAPGVTDLRRG
ncbi:MAG: hypothetical protein JNJ54_11830 [Myxococcaceae bacterium]|nr:hypothetical protein [Myxococcaceae bacterium]